MGVATLRNRIFSMGLFAALLKLLLIPSRPSTDIDVHAHWKAVTYLLPLSEWYTDTSSKWTLDYPPLFAYFEWLLSQIASVVRPSILVLDRVPTGGDIVFLRITVVATDVVLVYGAFSLIAALRSELVSISSEASDMSDKDLETDAHAAALVLFSPALFIVDNIHFQYNGLPLGVLLLSLSYFVRRQCTVAVVLFSVTVNLKHTLLPIAPVLGLFTIKTLFDKHAAGSFSMQRFAGDTAVVGTSFCVSFVLPWIPLGYIGGLRGIEATLRRLFPFGRGLLHAYWAPNFWALYAAADKVLCGFGLSVRMGDGDSASGLIGSMRPFRALGNVTPALCGQIVVAVLVPALVHIGFRSREVGANIPRLTGYSALAAFMFGWHVHEKNVLMSLIPLCGSMGRERRGAVWMSFALLVIGGTFGVFPLLTSPEGSAMKKLHFAVYCVYVITLAGRFLSPAARGILWAYLAGCCVVDAYSGVHDWLLAVSLPFLPLLLVSVYAALAVLSAFSLLIVALVRD